MGKLKYIFPFLFILGASPLSLQGQNNTPPPAKKIEVDMKEFDDHSFKDASRVIKDSSLLTQHILGVKWGYALSSVGFSTANEHKGIKSPMNFGIYYTYYHSLWQSMPYFGLHTGVGTTELGYIEVVGEKDNLQETEHRYRAIEIPFMTQFRADFWKMRIMLGVGAYGTYLISNQMGGEIPAATNRVGGGIIGGGGLALILKPFEVHFECNYKYSLTHFQSPDLYSKEYWVYTHSNQLQFSVGLYYRLGGKNKKR